MGLAGHRTPLKSTNATRRNRGKENIPPEKLISFTVVPSGTPSPPSALSASTTGGGGTDKRILSIDDLNTYGKRYMQHVEDPEQPAKKKLKTAEDKQEQENRSLSSSPEIPSCDDDTTSLECGESLDDLQSDSVRETPTSDLTIATDDSPYHQSVLQTYSQLDSCPSECPLSFWPNIELKRPDPRIYELDYCLPSFTTDAILNDSAVSQLDKNSWEIDRLGWESMLIREKAYHPDENFIGSHPALNAQHRAIVIDWLREVSHAHQLCRKTFHSSVMLFDLCMSRTQGVQPPQLQIIAGACCLIATKTEEYCSPKIWAEIDDPLVNEDVNTFFEVERNILNLLNWWVTPDTLVDWLQLYVSNAAMILPEHFSTNSKPSHKRESFRVDILENMFSVADIYVHRLSSLSHCRSVCAAGIFLHFASTIDNIPDIDHLCRVCTGFRPTQLEFVVGDITNVMASIPDGLTSPSGTGYLTQTYHPALLEYIRQDFNVQFQTFPN